MAVTDAKEDMENGPVAPTELSPPAGGDWVGVGTGPLPVEAAWRWAILPGCGGIVTFCGTVRDHSEGRPGVTCLEYEAYVEQVAPRLARVAADAREHWAEIGRLVLLHRVGRLEVAEVSVVVVASTPHRAGGVRGGAILHRHHQAHRPHLEARDVERWHGLDPLFR